MPHRIWGVLCLYIAGAYWVIHGPPSTCRSGALNLFVRHAEYAFHAIITTVETSSAQISSPRITVQITWAFVLGHQSNFSYYAVLSNLPKSHIYSCSALLLIHRSWDKPYLLIIRHDRGTMTWFCSNQLSDRNQGEAWTPGRRCQEGLIKPYSAKKN